MRLINPLRRLHAEERGIALIVAMAMLLILGIIAAAVFTNSLQIKNATATERSGKQAYAATLNGLRSAMYWLNASAPADTDCPPLPGQTAAQAANGANGLCGPYESDNMSGANGVVVQPLVGQRFTYWISPVLNSGTDTCTGSPPRVTSGATGVTVRDRCITAVGQALVGTQIKSTRRIQARVSATNAAFPVPGIFGAACLSAGVNFQANETDCSTSGNGVSTSDYFGTVGSNGAVNLNIKNWYYDPAINPDAGATLYLGNLSPTDPTIPSYSIKLQNNPAGTPTPTGCGSGLTYCTGSQPPLPYNTSATGPYQNPVHYFGRWYQPFRMGNYFARPDLFAPMRLPGNTLPTGCATPDVSACNNNSLITSASGTPANCGTISSSRVLTLASSCVLRIPNGTYDFCGIDVGNDSSILPADTSANAEVRIFLDNTTRTTAASPCANSIPAATRGTIRWPNGGGHPARWMTTGPASVSGPDQCPTAFPDVWSAFAGSLYVYGAGDPADATTNYPVNTTPLQIPGMMFDGSIIAMNTILNVTDSNTCINGGISAGKVNLANNVGFKWDPNIARSELSSTSTTFYRTAFSTCTAAGFRFASTSTAPSYPTNPSTGC